MTDYQNDSNTLTSVEHPPHLTNYDYHKGMAYAITILSKYRQPHFKISILRTILIDKWTNLTKHFTGVTPGAQIILPDHIQCILYIDPKAEGVKSISAILGGYKSIASNAWLHYVKDNQINYTCKIWHPRFYEYAIQDAAEFRMQQSYILEKPVIEKLNKAQQYYLINNK